MIYLWPDTALVLIKNRTAALHSHYAQEIYLGLDGAFQMDFGKGHSAYRCLVLNSQVCHQFTAGSTHCALILVNPTDSRIAPQLNALLNGHSFRNLSDPVNEIWNEAHAMDMDFEDVSCQRARGWVEHLVGWLHRCVAASHTVEPPQKDARIQSACEFIRHAYPNPIGLSQLADQAHLSHSRFRHLFKAETGLSIRHFILNTRAVAAVKMILEGETITSAAHGAGFSDAAHLSRTFTGMYGLSLSSLYKGQPDKTLHLCPPFKV